MLQGHHSCLCCTLCCTILEHMLLVGRKKPKPKQTTSAPQLHFVALRVSCWLVPEVPTGPSGPLLSCIPATYHHLFQSTTYQARSTCRVGQPWTPPTAEIIHLHTSPFLCLYLAPPCQRQKDSGGLNDRKRLFPCLFLPGSNTMLQDHFMAGWKLWSPDRRRRRHTCEDISSGVISCGTSPNAVSG